MNETSSFIYVHDRRDDRRTTLVSCGDSGTYAHPSTRHGDKAKCGSCGNRVPTETDTQDVVRLARHRFRMVNLPPAQMAEMREEQPERFV